MANQIVVTQSGNVQVVIEPTPNVQVQISRAAIGNITVSNVSVANTANYAHQVLDANQPNITSLGTITGLTSSGNITAPFFLGNVVGNISGNIVVPGTNTSVLFNDAGVAGASDAFQFNKSSNTVTVTGNLSATNISGNGAGLSNIAGANVTGQVSYAAVANSVSGSNVSGAVAYATTANSVAGANVSGQVAYAQTANSVAGANVSGAVNLATYATTANAVAGANVSGTVANATHATVADSANSVAGSNVSGQVSYAAVANSVAGANVSGQVSYAATANSVALANVVGAGNIASINIDGNGGNVLYGNGVFAAVVSPTSVANANYSNFAGNVVNSAQPNITSLGSLTGLVVAGDATVTGNLAVDGNLTYVNVTNLVVQDPVIEMGGGPNGAPLTTNDGRDRGSLLHYYTTQPVDAFMGWDNSNGEFGFGSNVTNTNDVMTFNSYGNVRASTFIGDLTGTASHATVADSANSVAGANVTGQVANALVAGTVYTNAQPNITSVGTLTSLDVSGNATFGNITNVDSITFDTSNVAPGAVGRFTWNDGDGTLDLGLKGGNVTLQVGEELVARVYNDDTVTLTDGMIVQITGAQGNRIAVKRAQANVEATSVHTLGMVTESIAVGAEGFVTAVGTVNELNTIGLTAGATLYLSPSTPGGYTETKPVAPDQLVVIGFVQRVHATVGSIYVKVDNGYELDELHNVLITSPTSGQALVYNSSNLWVNGVPAYANTANSVALANVVGAGNIASINLDGNVSNALLGNGSWGPVEVQSTSIANGTSNVSIPVANGAVAFGVNNVANLVLIDNGGIINTSPTSSIVNTMRINTFGSAIGDAHRIAWARARGSNTSPTSVNPNDNLGTLSFFGHNGTSYQTSSVGFVRARVDANYTANGANIPIGLQLIVNDTNGGVNNQSKTHNFYSNGNTSLSGALTIDGGSLLVSKNGGANPANVTVNGDGTTNSSMYLANVGFGVNWSNVDTSGGYSPFRFDQITSLTNEVGVIRNFRARGTSFSNISAVTANDYVYQQDYGVYGDAGNTYLSVGGSSVVVTGNDGAGNVPANLTISAGSGLGQSSSNIIFNAGNTQFNSNVTATNATLGNLATANYFTGDGGLLSNIAVANVTGLGNIATVNLDGNVSNILHGDGSWGPESETGNANYAAYAGNVTIAAQSNITSLGNLVSLTVKDSNTSNPSAQFVPTGNVVGTALLPNNMIRIDNYNDQGNANGVQGLAFVKSRGNSTTPAAAANSDPIMRLNSYVYNGNTYPKAVMVETTAPVAANTSLQLANTAWTGGAFRVTTGNPSGNVANASANSNQNLLQYNQNGTLTLLAGTNSNGTSAPSINMITYGIAANGVGATQPIISQRARGNRDSNVAVGNDDQLGGIGWQGYNGNAFFSTRFAQIRANVNTAHGTIANGSSVPTDLQFLTCSNTTGYTTYLYGNGSASFPGAVTSAGALNVTSGNISASNGNLNITSGNIIINGTSANPRNFVVNNGGAIFTIDNVDTTTASFAFATYNNANGLVNPYTFYRGRGNVATPAAVQAGDVVSSIGYNVYGDSGNAYVSVASTGVNIIANDGAGNVTADYIVTASKISLAGNVYPTNVVFTKFNETLYPIGTSSGTITPDFINGSIQTMTLNGNVTINSLGNAVAGSSMTLIITQDGTGGHTLTSSMLFAGASKTLSTAAGAKDIISVFYDGSTYYAVLSKGYA